MRRVVWLGGGLVVLCAIAVVSCRWVEERNWLSDDEFRSVVEESIAAGSTEEQVTTTLKEFAARHRSDGAKVRVPEAQPADWPYWGCLPEPCAPMHFGAPANARIVWVVIANSPITDFLCASETLTTWFFVIDADRGFTELYSYSREYTCLP
jgi:hypothetical protein